MRRFAPIWTACAALVAAAVPGAADTLALPAYCGSDPAFVSTLPDDREIILREHTLFFHGTLPSGEADVRLNPDNLFMDATAPTSAQSKEKVNLGTLGNPASNKNSLLTYWVGKLDAEQRIVCGTTTFHAVDTAPFSVLLFVDQPRGLAQAAVTAAATTTGGTGGVNTYSGTLGRSLDVTATSEIVLQTRAATTAPVLYDSTSHRGSFTYLTVELGAVTAP